jgi:hypothetical protein
MLSKLLTAIKNSTALPEGLVRDKEVSKHKAALLNPLRFCDISRPAK